MNLFQKYGIKEVADVTFYSITHIGDEIIYTPVLFLDTLKVSTIEKSAQKVNAEGGKGNKKLISWNFGKELSLSLEDALFSPASMSMIMSGRLNNKLSAYMSAIVKSNIANKYGLNNYSIKAYGSPSLTEEEWDLIYLAATEEQIEVEGKQGDNTIWYVFNNPEDNEYVIENRILLKKAYVYRTWTNNNAQKAMPQAILDKISSYIDELNKIGTIQTDNHSIEVVDRFERCTVRNKEGLAISTNEQRRNLFRYYLNDKTSSYTIYYDVKTMLPLLHVQDGKIVGWNSENDSDTTFILRPGTGYLKWTRTVKYVEDDTDGTLGNVLVIDAETFPGDYKIVGETYIRNQKTGKDQRYQIVINRAQVNSDTSISLAADGDPTTFNMTIDVLSPQNGDLMELKQFNVEEDVINGGTRIVAQNSTPTYTNTTLSDEVKIPEDINNSEIY